MPHVVEVDGGSSGGGGRSVGNPLDYLGRSFTSKGLSRGRSLTNLSDRAKADVAGRTQRTHDGVASSFALYCPGFSSILSEGGSIGEG